MGNIKIDSEVLDKITDNVVIVRNVINDIVLVEDEVGFWTWRSQDDIQLI